LEQAKKSLPVIDVEAEPVANQASDKDVECEVFLTDHSGERPSVRRGIQIPRVI
jgi:hypothetical protein